MHLRPPPAQGGISGAKRGAASAYAALLKKARHTGATKAIDSQFGALRRIRFMLLFTAMLEVYDVVRPPSLQLIAHRCRSFGRTHH